MHIPEDLRCPSATGHYDMNFSTVSRLSDEELVSTVARMAQSEREASASLIAHLAELWVRRLHQRAGYASLFTYCVAVLHHSESEAYDRMKAAKVARRYPAVLGLLASGRVSLTTIRLLAPHLTRESQAELFSAAAGKTKREVQVMLAQRFPLAPVPFSVRRLPGSRNESVPAATITGTTAGGPGGDDEILGLHEEIGSQVGHAQCGAAASDSRSVPGTPRPVVQPLAADYFRITFTSDAATCETLEMARDLLRHSIPDGDASRIFGRALNVLVEELVRQKYAITDRALASRGQADDSRNLPAEVKRKVYLRDRGRCAYISPSGRRCGERAFVEFHHIRPYAAGGLPTVENIALRCRAHNQYEAEVFFGAGVGSPARPGRPTVVSLRPRFCSGTKTCQRSHGR